MMADGTSQRRVMPAEWERHRATWVAWPHNRETWPHNLAEAQGEFVKLVAAIAEAETVCVVASGEALESARRGLSNVRNVEYFDLPTNDAWIRDYGPTFVVDSVKRELAAINWQYNGWGEKYPPFDDDQKVARRISELRDIAAIDSGLFVEGGALEVDGCGSLITTACCLLNVNRNGDARVECEKTFAELCGADTILWLHGAELPGDDTDGHIDQQVRFVDEKTIVVVRSRVTSGSMVHSLEANRSELEKSLGSLDRPIRLIDLDLPDPPIADRTIPASYLNFYLCNAGLILPQFGDPRADEAAAETLAALRTDRPVIRLPSVHLAYGLGSFHCLTQQEPETAV